MPQLSLHSPIGDISVSEEDGAIVAVDWGWGRDQERTPVLKEAKRQLEAYFDGKLTDFDLPLTPAGSTFHQKAWKELCRIPYGKILTYGDLAKRLKSKPRAVGGACAANPIPIIIPCHRVLAADGGLGGYSGHGGLSTKAALLALEGAPVPGRNQMELRLG